MEKKGTWDKYIDNSLSEEDEMNFMEYELKKLKQDNDKKEKQSDK